MFAVRDRTIAEVGSDLGWAAELMGGLEACVRASRSEPSALWRRAGLFLRRLGASARRAPLEDVETWNDGAPERWGQTLRCYAGLMSRAPSRTPPRAAGVIPVGPSIEAWRATSPYARVSTGVLVEIVYPTASVSPRDTGGARSCLR